jgi:hypothetical protein
MPWIVDRRHYVPSAAAIACPAPPRTALSFAQVLERETLVPSGIADKLRGVGRVLSDEVGVQQIPAFLIKAHRKPALFAIVCGSLSVF